MDNRREFLKKASLLAGGAGMMHVLPASIQKAFAIDPAPGSTYMDAEHIVFLMQENRSFDHTFGTLQGVRGFNDPRAITLPDKNPVWLQTSKEGNTYAPFRLNIKDTKATWMSSLPHSWSNQVDAGNYGKHNGWLDAKHSGNEEYKAMPLTMGYYNREDIPFYYALADAFTVCDHNFCSSLTGTTPNRLYFWSGTIRGKHDAETMARVWNGDADYENWADWTTFPERLEENGIPWKVYQNELSVGVGFEGEEDAWLANFTDNPLEFFEQYNVKLSPLYIANLPKMIAAIPGEIKKMEEELKSVSAGSEKEVWLKQRIEDAKKYETTLLEDQKKYTLERFEQLSPKEKSIYEKAFSTNKKDPYFHELTNLDYEDGNIKRTVQVPKGDILHQFREDVKSGNLPAVSWIVAPENYSDHPGAAWYGTWYTSEVLDILTQNPEVWKKTIFIITYDENDGYFDHLPPYSVPHKEGMGKVSNGIDASLEYVKSHQQSSGPNDVRESPIGLGFRVPMLVVSPWSRGGYVCSEVFDHTSCIQLAEKLLSHKYGKKVEETNITQWRRTVCGDLSSTFRPWNGEKIKLPGFMKKDESIESIHKAKFKKLPDGYTKLSDAQIKEVRQQPHGNELLPKQEKGIRASSAIPYELYVDGHLSEDKTSFVIQLKAGKEVFGEKAVGSPFSVYAAEGYKDEPVENWAYTVAAGDTLNDQWALNDFKNGNYHLRVYGPNGFYREFAGNANDPSVEMNCDYEKKKDGSGLTGNVVLKLKNNSGKPLTVEITDNVYKAAKQTKIINKSSNVVLNLQKSYGWYDFTVRVKGSADFHKRFAGHVETGKESKSDPGMGRMV
ncbi:MAG: phospholipase C, phosphocholine-specific [Bacteroidetes bacterium]|nr:phospholipase C, phosphocholine-specific [Bacteroidota bacterium]